LLAEGGTIAVGDSVEAAARSEQRVVWSWSIG